MEAGIDPFKGFTFDHSVSTKIGGPTLRHSTVLFIGSAVADLLSYVKSLNIRVAVYGSVERIL